jgi:hypothetical protein
MPFHPCTGEELDDSIKLAPLWYVYPVRALVLRLVPFVTDYDAILKASAEARHVKPLFKQPTDLRRMALMIMSFQPCCT